MNHNNWLISNDGQLYLVDWDNAKVGDPAIDIGMILQKYIDESEWDNWLKNYGIKKEKHLLDRMYWYLIAGSVSLFLKYCNSHQKAAKQLDELKRLIQKSRKAI